MAGGSGPDRGWLVDHAQQHMVGGRCEVGIGIMRPANAIDRECNRLITIQLSLPQLLIQVKGNVWGLIGEEADPDSCGGLDPERDLT